MVDLRISTQTKISSDLLMVSQCQHCNLKMFKVMEKSDQNILILLDSQYYISGALNFILYSKEFSTSLFIIQD